MPGNQLFAEGSRHIAAALREAKCRLSTLTLTGNSIGNEGIVILAAAVADNKTLEVDNTMRVCVDR
jgi:Ran GTPase-activating protein (RanGAP) involved in mRNA processing and transport